MKHASLFSGIGGFDLAADWMGWDNALQCEYDDFCQTILQYYWPYATQFKDIKTTDFTPWAGSIDILTGGFPCQPFSSAGKRQGTEDDRHLWPEMLRAISEIEPQWVVGENVGGIVNWNEGLVFEQVQADLEAQGYEVQPFILPASGVNAPHKRERTWFVAYANSQRASSGCGAISEKDGKVPEWNEGAEFGNSGNAKASNATDTESERISRKKEHENNQRQGGERRRCYADNNGKIRGSPTNTQQQGLEGQNRQELHATKEPAERNRGNWQNFPTESPICGRNDGLPTGLDGITVPRWRKESIKAYGNAIVPQVAFQIFKAIQETILHESNRP